MSEMPSPARPRAQRIADTIARFEADVDCWVSTASAAGEPHLVPLSFLWWREHVVLATERRMLTIRNLEQVPRVRLGFGLTRDVVVVSAIVDEFVPAEEVEPALGDAFAAAAGFDPRTLSGSYVYALARPLTIRAWREENELADRDLMRDGQWLI